MHDKLRRVTVFMVALALVLTSVSAFACTGLYVGKQVSKDGAVLIARTVDTHPCLTPNLEVVMERVENVPGRTLEGEWGFSYPLTDTTYKYTATPMATGVGAGRYASACMNEMGLAVTGTVTAYVQGAWNKVDPPVYEGGLCEEVLPDLIASSCATAREGVELIGKVIAEVGNAEQNIIMIADQNEAWYVETYTGHQWAAVKMPEDCVAVYGNQFMIEYIDPESEDVMYSPELFTLPEKAGLAVYDEDGRMNIFSTYAGKDRLANYANRRTWIGHALLAPSTAGEYGTTTKYDLFYKPDAKVGVEDAIEVLRNRLEGTQWSPDETGRVDQRVIGTETQCTSHVMEVFDDLPAEMACVGWTCIANSEHSVYLPISNLVTDTAEAYKLDSSKEEGIAYNPAMASIAYKRLCTLSEQDRVNYGAGVRAYWHQMEQELIASYPQVLAQTAKLYETSPEEAAAYITEYTIGIQNKALEDANAMFDDLLLYMMNNTDTLKTSFNYDNLTMSDTVTQKPFVPFYVEEEAQ